MLELFNLDGPVLVPSCMTQRDSVGGTGTLSVGSKLRKNFLSTYERAILSHPGTKFEIICPAGYSRTKALSLVHKSGRGERRKGACGGGKLAPEPWKS